MYCAQILWREVLRYLHIHNRWVKCLFTCSFIGLCQTGDVVLVPQKHNNIRALYFPLWMKSQKQWNIIMRKNHLIILCPGTSSTCFRYLLLEETHARSALLIQLAIKLRSFIENSILRVWKTFHNTIQGMYENEDEHIGNINHWKQKMSQLVMNPLSSVICQDLLNLNFHRNTFAIKISVWMLGLNQYQFSSHNRSTILSSQSC